MQLSGARRRLWDMTPRHVRRRLAVLVALVGLSSACTAEDRDDAGPDPTRPASPAPASRSLLEPDLDTGQRVSDLFVDFALAGERTPPVDTPVDLYLGNVLVKTISSSDSRDPRAYDLCESDGERACTTSAVSAVRAAGPGGTRLGGSGGECLVRRGDALSLGGPPRVTIRPAAGVSCEDDFAVQLFISDVGQMTAVNLLLGSAAQPRLVS